MGSTPSTNHLIVVKAELCKKEKGCRGRRARVIVCLGARRTHGVVASVVGDMVGLSSQCGRSVALCRSQGVTRNTHCAETIPLLVRFIDLFVYFRAC
jgi:hypothetical protein